MHPAQETLTGATVRSLKHMQKIVADHEQLKKIWSQCTPMERKRETERRSSHSASSSHSSSSHCF